MSINIISLIIISTNSLCFEFNLLGWLKKTGILYIRFEHSLNILLQFEDIEIFLILDLFIIKYQSPY